MKNRLERFVTQNNVSYNDNLKKLHYSEYGDTKSVPNSLNKFFKLS